MVPSAKIIVEIMLIEHITMFWRSNGYYTCSLGKIGSSGNHRGFHPSKYHNAFWSLNVTNYRLFSTKYYKSCYDKRKPIVLYVLYVDGADVLPHVFPSWLCELKQLFVKRDRELAWRVLWLVVVTTDLSNLNAVNLDRLSIGGVVSVDVLFYILC